MTRGLMRSRGTFITVRTLLDSSINMHHDTYHLMMWITEGLLFRTVLLARNLAVAMVTMMMMVVMVTVMMMAVTVTARPPLLVQDAHGVEHQQPRLQQAGEAHPRLAQVPPGQPAPRPS